MEKNPVMVIIIPPMNSHFQATYTIANKNNQGIALKLLNNIPLKPPPKVLAPENRANRKQRVVIIINAILEKYRRYFSTFILFKLLVSFFILAGCYQ